MATLNDWDTVDANNNAAPPNGWPENTMQYSEVNDTGRAVQGTLKRYFADVNGSLSAGGVADAYTLNLNESGYTAYFDGMYFACKINTTNTGASTINVNSIGVQNIVNADGSALEADTLEAGGIYEFRYDGTNFQVTGVTAGTSVTVGQAIFTNSNDPDLVDTDVAINAGASDPDTAQHIEIGPSDIQSKSDATTAATLGLNDLGGDVTIAGGGGNTSINASGGNALIGAQSGTGSVSVYEDGGLKFETQQNGLTVYGNVAAATPPTTEAVTTRIALWDSDATDRLGFFGFASSNTLLIENEMHGGAIQLAAEDAGGTLRSILFGDPDDTVQLFYAGDRKIETTTIGANIFGSIAKTTPPTGNADSRIVFYDSDGSDVLASLGYPTSDTFLISNVIHGGGISLEAESSGGVNRFLCNGDPDGVFNIYHAGVNVAATLAAASGGFQVNNQLTGGGLERVLTTSDLGGVATLSGCTVYRADALYSAPIGVFSIPFVSEHFDDAAWHDNVTNNTRLTVPAGISRVQLSGAVRTATGETHEGRLYIAKNGSRNYIGIGYELMTIGIGGITTGGIGCVTGWLSVSPGDYFELQFDNQSGAARNLDDNFTWFSVIGY